MREQLKMARNVMYNVKLCTFFYFFKDLVRLGQTVIAITPEIVIDIKLVV